MTHKKAEFRQISKFLFSSLYCRFAGKSNDDNKDGFPDFYEFTLNEAISDF